MSKVGRPKRKDLDPVDQSVVVQLYEKNGFGMRQISEVLAASYWEVREVLKKHGVQIRPRGRKKESF